MKSEIDTGASVTQISEETYNEQYPNTPLPEVFTDPKDIYGATTASVVEDYSECKLP